MFPVDVEMVNMTDDGLTCTSACQELRKGGGKGGEREERQSMLRGIEM
jgi:hypothetical protein